MIKKTLVKSKSCYKVTFSLPKEAATNASEVKVLGDFNNWNWESGLKMKANKTAFTAALELETGKEYQFRYLIDNQVWENDWEADAYVSNPYGVENSVVACPSVTGVPVSKTTKKVANKRTATKAETTKTVAKKTTTKKVATKKTKPVAKKTVAKKVTTKATSTKTTKAVTANKAMTSVANKMKKKGLQVIEGVGPKIEKLMNEAGLMTFNDVAKAPVAKLKKVLENAGSRFRMHNPSTWTQQAKLAHEGKWNELKTLQDSLKGGRK